MNKEFLIEFNYDNHIYKFYIEKYLTVVYVDTIRYINNEHALYCKDKHKHSFNKLLYSSEYIVFSNIYTFGFYIYKPYLNEYWISYLKLDDVEELKHSRTILNILE